MSRKRKAQVPSKCDRQKDMGRKGKVHWRPAPERYLLVMCSGGQLSNRISCIRQHMLDAALLNRTLVFPSHGVDYDYDRLLDMNAPRRCFGNDSFLTLDEFLVRQQQQQPKGKRQRGKPVMTVNAFVCHVHEYQGPKVCDGLIKKYEQQLGGVVRFGKPIIPDFHTPNPWFKYSAADFVAKFAYPNAHIVAFGNMFGVGGRDFRFRASAPLAVLPECRYYLMPNPAIIETATGFVNAFLGSRFIAVHMRRGDFYDHCKRISQKAAKAASAAAVAAAAAAAAADNGDNNGGGKPSATANTAASCFMPLQQMARCIERRVAENPGVRMVYLSTNGDDMEVRVLQELLATSRVRGGISVVRMPVLDNQPWAEAVRKQDLHRDEEVVSFIEKTICVMASVFYGTTGSTFSGDIMRLRDWLFTRSCGDSSICPEDEPVDNGPVLTR